MNICILATINPSDIKELLFDDNVLDTGSSFGSVTALIKGLVSSGNYVYIISVNRIKKKKMIFEGTYVHITLISSKASIPFMGFFAFDKYIPKRISFELKSILEKIDVIHAQWTYEYAQASCDYANKITTFCTVRDWFPYIEDFADKNLRSRLFIAAKGRMFEKVISNPNIYFIANSEYTQELIYRKLQKNVPILPNSIDSSFFEEKKVIKRTPIYLSIAQDLDEYRKNISTLLDAFKIVLTSIPKAHLLLVGRHSDTGIYNYCKKLEISNSVHFLGSQSREQLKKIIDISYIYVHPALEETFGNVFLEAMARGIPVIGGEKSGAVPRVLQNGNQGLLCDVTDSITLANSMIEMYRNIELYKHFVISNYTYVRTFSDICIAMKHVDLYKSYMI